MKRSLSHILLAISILFLGIHGTLISQEQKPLPEENFYTKSLHYTNKGIEYTYSKEQGGLERLTGLSAEQAGCTQSKCHVRSCDACHVKESEGAVAYSKDAARSPKICHQCHGEMEKDNPDVHFAKGMKCMDCHSAREIHGDGVAHNTYMEPGVMDTRCEKCHSSITHSVSHTVHKGKLDCSVCHSLSYETCLNCHVETRLKGGKETRISLKHMIFLINHDGKVKLANMLSYVYQNKTMITFAPTFSHSIKKEGRKCNECHNSKIVQDMKKRDFRLVRWENGKLTNVEGIIPVLAGMNWNLVYFDRKDSTWVPLDHPAEPLLNYSGYSSPITQEQFDKLIQPDGKQ
jgi:hypothetical protein